MDQLANFSLISLMLINIYIFLAPVCDIYKNSVLKLQHAPGIESVVKYSNICTFSHYLRYITIASLNKKIAMSITHRCMIMDE